MAEIGKLYAGDPGVVMVSVGLDKSPEKRAEWAREFGGAWVNLSDGDGELSKAFGSRGKTPTYFVVDGDGKIRFTGMASHVAVNFLADLRLSRFLKERRAAQR
jgi:hypothetical protein